MEASEPKWVNSDYIQYEVNSIMVGGLQLMVIVGLLIEYNIKQRLKLI